MLWREKYNITGTYWASEELKWTETMRKINCVQILFPFPKISGGKISPVIWASWKKRGNEIKNTLNNFSWAGKTMIFIVKSRPLPIYKKKILFNCHCLCKQYLPIVPAVFTTDKQILLTFLCCPDQLFWRARAGTPSPETGEKKLKYLKKKNILKPEGLKMEP